MAKENAVVGVVGLGLMGRGIAGCLVGHGVSVRAYTTDPAEYAPARLHVSRCVEELVARAGFDPTLRERWTRLYHESNDITGLAGCDFVIETIVEDLPAKRQIYGQLEQVVDANAVIASNTSAIPITTLQQGRRYPERFVGMHWFDPCHVTRFCEVIRGERTSTAAADAALALARSAGKDPSLVRKDVDGFLVNRIAYAMYREALWLLESGVADAETIDRTCKHVIGVWSSLMGPLRWMDLSGLPTYARVMERLFPQLSRATEVPPSMRDLTAAGAQGIRNGHGFHRYSPDDAKRWQERFVEHCWAIRDLERPRDGHHSAGNDRPAPSNPGPAKRPLFPGGRDTAVGTYSPGIAVGDMMFVSGQGPIDPVAKAVRLGSIEDETRLTLSNVQRVLNEADCTMADVVKTTVHLRDIADFARFNAVYQSFFAPPYPARTTVQSGLDHGISVEIDAIAIRRST
jgi:3-hydroxybutyryl-CoA dehydrogenase